MKFFITLFCLSFSGQFFLPLFFPAAKILGFLPYIIFAISRLSLAKALWCSAFCGLVIDLTSFGPPLGFFALNYSLSTLILFRYKKFFSEENLFAFSLYAIIFSITSTSIHFFLYAIIDNHLKLSFITLLTDLFCMPIIDGVYTLLWALFPILLYKHLTEPDKILFYKAKLRTFAHGLSRITR